MTRKHIFQRHILSIWLLLVSIGYGCCVEAETASLNTHFSQQAENIDQVYFNEPSDIVFHAERGTLFVVGDEGDICEIQTAGILVKQKRILNADFEGVTYIPLTGILLSGLHYDRTSDHIYVISDMLNTFFEITKTGKVLKSFPFPGIDQEGITLDGAGFVYIAQDSGGIMKIKWNE